jgi:hypothetical protein
MPRIYRFISYLKNMKAYCASSVGTATGCGIEFWVRIPAGESNCSFFPQISDRLWRPLSHPISTGGSFPRVKRPGRKAYGLPQSRPEVKHGLPIPPLRIRLQGVLLNLLRTETKLPLSDLWVYNMRTGEWTDPTSAMLIKYVNKKGGL